MRGLCCIYLGVSIGKPNRKVAFQSVLRRNTVIKCNWRAQGINAYTRTQSVIRLIVFLYLHGVTRRREFTHNKPLTM
jgi:hypothetical protein